MLKKRPVVEDCSIQEEYCFSTTTTVSVRIETALCRTKPQLNCSQELESEVCFNKTLAFCSQKPQLVTVTAKKQPCGAHDKMTTSKICLTHPDGRWSCQNLTQSLTCNEEVNVTKVITSEIASGHSLECNQKSVDLQCSRCAVVSLEQECVRDSIPTDVDLKETVCEKCVQGRRSVRPFLEETDVCRSVPVTFCSNVTVSNRDSSWKKWCRSLDLSSTQFPLAVPAIKNV